MLSGWFGGTGAKLTPPSYWTNVWKVCNLNHSWSGGFLQYDWHWGKKLQTAGEVLCIQKNSTITVGSILPFLCRKGCLVCLEEGRLHQATFPTKFLPLPAALNGASIPSLLPFFSQCMVFVSLGSLPLLLASSDLVAAARLVLLIFLLKSAFCSLFF